MKPWKPGDPPDNWLETVMGLRENRRMRAIFAHVERINNLMTEEEREAYPEIFDQIDALIKASQAKNPLFEDQMEKRPG